MQKRYVVGVDLGGTNIKAALFDQRLQFAGGQTIPTEAESGPDHVLRRIRDIVAKLLTANHANEEDVICMGLGVTGLLDPIKGWSVFSPNFPNWRDIPVVDRLQAECSFPVFIDNDVRVNLYGEWWYGAGRGMSHFMLITLGTGLGSGVVSGGNVLYGATFSAGELGHMHMVADGPACGCGGNGCLETYASATGIVNSMKRELAAGKTSIVQQWTAGGERQLTARMISDAFDAGDPLAIEVMRFTGELLGIGLANAVNLFNPQRIIVGGGMASAGDRLLAYVRETIQRRALALSAQACEVVMAELGQRAGMIGAAAYAHRRLNGQLCLQP